MFLFIQTLIKGPSGATGPKGTRGESGLRGENGLMGPPGRPGEVGQPVRNVILLKRIKNNLSFIKGCNWKFGPCWTPRTTWFERCCWRNWKIGMKYQLNEIS
jgi:Collagen triple helix repeat (20 copies)